jgi:hypothetical protein
MTNIDDIKEFIEFVVNKVQSGNSVTPDQFNLSADRAQMVIYEADYDKWRRTKDASDFILSFVKTVDLAISSIGYALYPLDWQHSLDIKSYYVRSNGQGIFVPIVESVQKDWGTVESSLLLIPNKRFPKFSEYADHIEFLPRDLGVARFSYFSRPVKPIWAYTVVNNRPVYDPTNSVQFQESEYAMDRIIPEILSYYGVNLKDSMLAQYSEMFKQENSEKEVA